MTPDEILDLDAGEQGSDLGLAGEATLLAALDARRTGQMGDIVATIQAEQDRIIRSDLRGALVVQAKDPAKARTAIERLSPQNYCTVFAYSPGAGRAYSNAVAVIRAASSGRPHFRIGALAHLGPLTDQEATAFLQPDPELERLARAEDEDHLYR